MIHTIDLFEPLDDLLLGLLRSLSREDWGRPTVAGRWTVREVAAHLLDTPLRRLSFVRDSCPPADVSIASDADLLAFVNEMNAAGVRTYGRLSPPVLIDLMVLATRQLRDHLRASADDAPAAFPVSWAGESASAHWFDVAREYTERWHHQAQIRLAVDAMAPLMAAPLYAPVLATFARALPCALRGIDAAAGTQVSVVMPGEGGAAWTVTRTGASEAAGPAARWAVHVADADDAGPFAATVTIPADVAWRLFTKSLTPDAVAQRCRAAGDPRLAGAVLEARAVVG